MVSIEELLSFAISARMISFRQSCGAKSCQGLRLPSVLPALANSTFAGRLRDLDFNSRFRGLASLEYLIRSDRRDARRRGAAAALQALPVALSFKFTQRTETL